MQNEALLRKLRDDMSRVTITGASPVAVHAAPVLTGPPYWPEYYRILDDIAGDCVTMIGQLHATGLTARASPPEFTKAANNRTFATGCRGSTKPCPSTSS